MPLDLKRLTAEAKNARNARVEKEKSGTFASIRSALPRIEKLRAAGVRWREIAEALAAQGIEQGSPEAKKPLSASRLTSIVSKLKAADQRRADKVASRVKRSDLTKLSAKSGNPVKMQLSRELAFQRSDATETANTIHKDVETLRRERLAEVRAFTKGGEKE